MGLLEDLKSNILIGDGAMGTLLYSNQIDRCFEELNLSHSQQIIDIHRAYLEAGSQVIQTNTYAGNAIKLARYGLEHLVKDINKSAVKLAREAVKDQAYVLGTIGGIRGIQKEAISISEIKDSFLEQLVALSVENIDGLILETYYDYDELATVVELARKETNLPIIAQLSLHEVGVLQNGVDLASAFDSLLDLGADIVGLNCRMGPFHMIRSLEEVAIPSKGFLSAYPNASLPDYSDGRFVYQSNPNYFAESALRFREQGVRLIGGCCGTTPDHIKAMADAIKDLPPVTEKNVKKTVARQVVHIKGEREKPLHEIVKKRKSVIVELDPPKTLDTTKFLEGAKQLKHAGVDAVTMADNSLASPRISNMALGSIIKNELNTRPLVHVTCRDRNLIGLQSHLLGLHTLGIDQVLAVTGDPTKVGDFPGATSVYDLSSFDLIQLMKQMNEGLSFSGKSLGQKTSFSIAAAFNPNVRHLDKAVQRLEKKIQSGADYFMSQPVYSEQQIVDIYEATKHLDTPIYLGIMPLTSTRNAEFLHNEVPGIKLTDEIRQVMANCGDDKEKAEQEGIAIAKSLIDVAYEYFNGLYIITPFFRHGMTVELTNYVYEKEKKANVEFRV